MNYSPAKKKLTTFYLILTLITITSQKRKRKLEEDEDDKNPTLDLSSLETKDKDPRKLIKEYLSEFFENEQEKISRVQLRDLICRNYTKMPYEKIHEFAFVHQRVNNIDHLQNKKRRFMEFYHDIDIFMMRLKSLSFGYKEVYDIFLHKKYNLFYREWHKEDIEKLFYENLHSDGKEEEFISRDL